MKDDFKPAYELNRALQSFYVHGVCPSFEQFKRKIVPAFAMAGMDGCELTKAIAVFKREWWRIPVEFEKEWKAYPVEVMCEELERCA